MAIKNVSPRSSNDMLSWQYKTLLGELQQIELHESGDCPCILTDLNPPEKCIGKHLLNISTLSAETSQMDSHNSKWLLELAGEANERHEQFMEFVCHTGNLPPLSDWARKWRKEHVEPVYYSCKAKVKLKQEPTCSLMQVTGYKTAMSRKTPPEPLKWLHDHGHLEGRSLDYGSGRHCWYGMECFDPYWKPERPTGSFDTITCIYVLNVVTEAEQANILKDIKSLLKPEGQAFFAVRRDLAKSGQPGRGTTQRYVKLPYEVLNENNSRAIYGSSIGYKGELHQEPKVRISGSCTTKGGCSLKVKGAVETIQITTAAGLPDAINEVIRHLEKRSEGKASPLTYAIGSTSLTRYELRYAIREAKSLIPSNDPITFELNPDYPQDLQPRLRGRAANKAQVKSMAANLDPDALLDDFHSIDRGAPIVDDNGVVLSGNGRVMAIQNAIAEFPASYELYNQHLGQAATNYGLKVGKIKSPVLVRELVSKVDKKTFVEEANASTSIAASAIEVARSDAQKITTPMLNTLEVADGLGVEDALRSNANASFVSSFLSKLSANDRAGVADAKGLLNQDGIRRLTMAIFVNVFPGDVGIRLAEKFFEATDANARNIFNGIVGALGKLAQSEALVRDGQRNAELLIGDDLARAVVAFSDIKKTPGMTVEKYLNQSAMFERQLNDFQEKLLSLLDSRSRSGKKVAALLKAYANVVIASPPPSQGALIPGETLTKDQALDAAVKRSEDIETVAMIQDKENWRLTSAQYLSRLSGEMADDLKVGGVGGLERARYISRYLRRNKPGLLAAHHRLVATAVEAGLPVPDVVKWEYPDIEHHAKTVKSQPLNMGDKTVKLSPQLIDGMNVLIERTAQTKKEHGMDMCRNKDGVLIPGMACKGTACSIYIRDCAGMVKEGSFHTHPALHKWEGASLSPEVSIIPSGQDILNAKVGDVKCVGSPFTNNVNCWTHKPTGRKYYCPKKRAWSYLTPDVPQDLAEYLQSSRQVCTGVKESFDFITINRKGESYATGDTRAEKKTEATEEVKPVQARLFREPTPKWCPSVDTAAREIDKAIKAIGTSRNRLNILRGKLEPSLNVCKGQSLMFQKPEAKLADPLLATIARELCTTGICLASDKKPLPVCTPKKAEKLESCILSVKDRNASKGCKAEGTGTKKCPSPFAVCQSSLKCKIPVKA